jgi:protein-S-isoprenylcysteine O-methyltransferase Ste14
VARLAAAGEEGRRSGLSFGLSSALSQLWFGLNFFVSFPSLVLYFADTSLRPPPGPNLALGGAVIVLAHLALVLLIVDFVRSGVGTQNPLDPPRELVQRGAYRWIRNPMYLLYVVVVLGLAILYRSVPLLAYAGVFALCTHLYVVLLEEKALQRRFGAAYTDYCRRTGRWLPHSPKAARSAPD